MLSIVTGASASPEFLNSTWTLVNPDPKFKLLGSAARLPTGSAGWHGSSSPSTGVGEIPARHSAARTASSVSISPDPKRSSRPGSPISSTMVLSASAWSNSSGVRPEWTDSIRAATPATCGVAIEVPLYVAYPPGSSQLSEPIVLKTPSLKPSLLLSAKDCPPGALTSTSVPKVE